MSTKVPIFKYLNSENEFNVYANHTGMAISSFDISLMFGQIIPQMGEKKTTGEQELNVIKLGSVTMSPVHAKLVCANLQANIEKYEKMFGTINLPLTPEKGQKD